MSDKQHFEVPQEYAELYERAYRRAATDDLDAEPPPAGPPAPARRRAGARRKQRRGRARSRAPRTRAPRTTQAPPPVVEAPVAGTARIEVAPPRSAPVAGRRSRSGRRRRGGWWRGDVALAIVLVLLLAILGAGAAFLGRMIFGRPADATVGLLGLASSLL